MPWRETEILLPKAMATVLHKPLQLGRIDLSHRIVLAPCTRYRVDEQHKILDIVPTYYGERASVPGTLLITEATAVSLWAAGGKRTPVLETDEQVAAWKRVVDAVHERKRTHPDCILISQMLM
jgi:NADPH2 dehydrogenase